MSDELPESGSQSDHAPMEVALHGSSNGVHHDDAAAVATAIAPDAETPEETVGTEAGGSGDPIAAQDSTSDLATAEPAETAAATAEATADTPAGSADATPDDGSGFLADLVKAMQTTAASERARLIEDADRRLDGHLAAVEARRTAEVGRMRELAADDLKGIDAWAEDERQRIQAEHDRRAAALQADLETSLAQHSGRIEREVTAVRGAVTTYRSEVDAFFASLDRESDPVAIARQASRRPAFPALEDVGATASAEPADAAEAAGGIGIGVMADPATLAQGVDALSADLAASREASAAGDPAGNASDADDTDEAAVAAEAGVGPDRSTAVLHAVPSSRPMGWLRRDRDQEHPER